MSTFMENEGNWEKTVKADTLKVIQHYKEKEGIQVFGMYGMCWGGEIAFLAGTQLPDIRVIGALHAFGLTLESMREVKVPAVLMPAGEDPDLVKYTLRIFHVYSSRFFMVHHK